MRTVSSFDIFDTCLCRLCGEPRLLFDVLSLRVQKLMGGNASEHMRQLFVAARIASGGNSLEEIYGNVARSFPLPCTVEEMARLELDTERDMLRPIAATLRLVDEARRQGHRIIFISDMYLPDDFLRGRLAEFGFYREGDGLYVSNTVGAFKYDGSLFRHVREREGLSYRHWRHYGDNPTSDCTMPRRLGIKAKRLDYGYLHYERQWMALPVVGYQWARIMAGVARAVRLQSGADLDQRHFVADISAPFMVAWVAEILRDATTKGIGRLYFLARDVHSQFLIARHMGGLFPGVDVRYALMSSYALYADPLSPDYMRSLGFADDMAMAVVDSCTCGRTLQVINQQVGKPENDGVKGYLIMHIPTKETPSIDNSDYIFSSSYLGQLTSSRINRVGGMRIFFELLFSVNYHNTVVGYEYHGDRLRPVLAPDKRDEYSFTNRPSRDIKRNNDSLLMLFTDAFVSTGLLGHSEEVLRQAAIPTLIDFVDMPRREYCAYLNRFHFWGKPFVGSLWGGHNEGVWKRGNRAYSLPAWVTTWGYSVMRNAALRRRINHIAGLLRLPRHK
ncbi:MAG: hypothetical protein IJ760_00830 [Bacteroidales bacterium]|nr:hypothetical protein [Bacteroidales bacterium]